MHQFVKSCAHRLSLYFTENQKPLSPTNQSEVELQKERALRSMKLKTTAVCTIFVLVSILGSSLTVNNIHFYQDEITQIELVNQYDSFVGDVMNSEGPLIDDLAPSSTRDNVVTSGHNSLNLDQTGLFDLEQFYSEHPIKRTSINTISVAATSGSSISSSSILINDSASLAALSLDGTGTENDPYLIENLNIETNSSEYGITLEDSTEYFVIANNVISHNTNLTNGGGINLQNVTNVVVQNNTLTEIFGHSYGIHISDSTNFSISDNSLQHVDRIHIENSNSFEILNNILFDPGDCLEISDSYEFNIGFNSIDDSQWAICVREGVSHHFDIYSNTISKINVGIFITKAFSFNVFNHTISDWIQPTPQTPPVGHRIYFDNSNDFTIVNNKASGTSWLCFEAKFSFDIRFVENSCTDNNNVVTTVSPKGGIMFWDVIDILLEKNTVDNVDGDSIWMQFVTNSQVHNNDFLDSDGGILIDNSENVNFTSNFFSGIQVAAIKLENVCPQASDHPPCMRNSNILIFDNLIQESPNAGLRIDQADNIMVIDNRFNRLTKGIVVQSDTTNLWIEINKFNLNDVGISTGKGSELTIFDNTFTDNSDFGIELSGSSSNLVHNNLISGNGVGISTKEMTELRVFNNEFLENKINAISVDQKSDPGYLLIENNIINDHTFSKHASVSMKVEWVEVNPKIIFRNNTMLDNLNGIDITGGSVLFTDNLFIGKSEGAESMEYAIELQQGSSSNVIKFNEFRNSATAHIRIRSSINSSEEALMSLNNIISWNSFYQSEFVQAYDQFAQNVFAYNYWEIHKSIADESEPTFKSTEYLLASSATNEFNPVDRHPLDQPATKAMMAETSFFPSPIILSLENEQEIERENLVDDKILVEWDQAIRSDLFLFGNNSDFKFKIEYKPQRSDVWTLIGETDLTSYIWGLSGVTDGLYDLQITSTDKFTASTVSAMIGVNIGPVSTASFFDDPVNIGITFVGVVGLTAFGVYGVTTYRHRMALKREADVEGRAADYIDFVKDIKDQD